MFLKRVICHIDLAYCSVLKNKPFAHLSNIWIFLMTFLSTVLAAHVVLLLFTQGSSHGPTYPPIFFMKFIPPLQYTDRQTYPPEHHSLLQNNTRQPALGLVWTWGRGQGRRGLKNSVLIESRRMAKGNFSRPIYHFQPIKSKICLMKLLNTVPAKSIKPSLLSKMSLCLWLMWEMF